MSSSSSKYATSTITKKELAFIHSTRADSVELNGQIKFVFSSYEQVQNSGHVRLAVRVLA